MRMRLGFVAAGLAIFILAPAQAQPSAAALGEVVASCGTPNHTYVAGTKEPITVNTSGLHCESATLSGGGDASAANQTAVQANAGSDASKAVAVQGIAGGKGITVLPGNTANTTPWLISPQAATTGGSSNYTLQPAASDNHAVVKNGAGTVYSIDAFSNGASINYVRLYDAGTGFNGCNSATNLMWEGMIPASTSVGGFAKEFGPVGRAFTNGLSICVTGGYGNTDTTNATASQSYVNIGYK